MMKKFSQQFAHPKGFFGGLAGQILAMSTRARTEWTLTLLDVRPDNDVLEIGYGPGVGIQIASRSIDTGKVVGLDISKKMHQQARRRNLHQIKAGKVELFIGSLEQPLQFHRTFDKVFSINSVQFWPDRSAAFEKLYQLLKKDGRVAITYQPLEKGATNEDGLAFGKQLIKEGEAAGFISEGYKIKSMKPTNAVCLLFNKR